IEREIIPDDPPPGSVLILPPDPEKDSHSFESIDTAFTSEFIEHLGLSPTATVSLASSQLQLQRVEQQTGTRSAFIYVVFTPTFERQQQEALGRQNLHDSDQLELLMVTSEREVIRRVVPGATRANVLDVVRKYQRRLNRWQGGSPRYLTLAQTLYQWMIDPLSEALEEQGIDNLLFSMESGLRSLPIAALHDGEQFLVEQYSVGLVPSLTLTDMQYINLQDAHVLALGASEFESLSALPGVPLELSLITDELWPGTAFLNEDATLKQLQDQQSTGNYRILHLATHANFASGAPENSFIQLWDQPLRLTMFRDLDWNPNNNTSLMVLSACQTALGNDEAELGFAGFAVHSGVQSALASLWSVNDLGTLLLMTEFYQNLQISTTRAEALRQAQLSMLQGQARLNNGQITWSGGAHESPPELGWSHSQDFTHPYYWSGFTMVGSPW
ncbi:MAG: CHAT domain-containing protein, partial [Symploca sp. SIO2B6]|nr:CHAT domain-containing protein [Symploca sp. SIO2B6]